ncbi:MAG: YdhR family protein [Phycisphaerales bacterium]|jgi:heme-degrading monooxygenase HmoA|nr:YdhR family protein [Phycisphaerales bacterium]
MHILIINFNLEGITRAEYEAGCDEVAPAFEAIPGLVCKHWLADDDTNTFGGVYVFESEEALEAYRASDLFAEVAGNPAFANATVRAFGRLEGPSKVTRC